MAIVIIIQNCYMYISFCTLLLGNLIFLDYTQYIHIVYHNVHTYHIYNVYIDCRSVNLGADLTIHIISNILVGI